MVLFLKKLLNAIKKHGFIGVIKKILKKIQYKLYKNMYINNNKKNLVKIIHSKQWKKIIVYENNFGWSNIMKQRPQQIASSFDDDVLFIYGSSFDEYDDNSRIKEIKNNLHLVDLNIYRKIILNLLDSYNNKFLMIYSTDYIKFEIIEEYINTNFKIIYEYVDDIDEVLCGKETAKLLSERHNKIINNNNSYIITTATKLYNNVKNTNKNSKVTLVTNGVDYEYFKNNPNTIPDDMKSIIGTEKKIIGYYGALASWFDYELIKKLSNHNKEYKIVLIGMDYDNTLEKSKILNLDNVYYLGKKDYDILSSYSYNFDVCIIPFIINDITLSTSPVKVFEYMAISKPIVTTDLPECKKYNSIFVSKTHEEFIENIESALLKGKEEKYLELLKKEALENTWHKKCKNIIDFISEQ